MQLVRGQRRCQNDGLGSGPAGQLVKTPPEPRARAAGAIRPEASAHAAFAMFAICSFLVREESWGGGGTDDFENV